MKLEELMNVQLNEFVGKDENADLDKAPAPGKLGEFCTTAQAAKILGVSMSRVRQFIMEKRLKSYSPEKGRRDNMLKISEVKAFARKEREITGRPKEGESDKKEDKKD